MKTAVVFDNWGSVITVIQYTGEPAGIFTALNKFFKSVGLEVESSGLSSEGDYVFTFSNSPKREVLTVVGTTIVTDDSNVVPEGWSYDYSDDPEVEFWLDPQGNKFEVEVDIHRDFANATKAN